MSKFKRLGKKYKRVKFDDGVTFKGNVFKKSSVYCSDGVIIFDKRHVGRSGKNLMDTLVNKKYDFVHSFRSDYVTGTSARKKWIEWNSEDYDLKVKQPRVLFFDGIDKYQAYYYPVINQDFGITLNFHYINIAKNLFYGCHFKFSGMRNAVKIVSGGLTANTVGFLMPLRATVQENKEAQLLIRRRKCHSTKESM